MAPNPLYRARAPTGLVTIVLPAKDEEAAIGKTIRALPIRTLSAMGLSTELVVLDGRSRDATAAIAREAGAHVIVDREPGKTSAMRNARDAFRGDYVVMLDADGSYATDAIPRALGPLLRGEADVVMGDRVPLPGAMTPSHKFGNAVLSLTATVLYVRPCPDVCTGLWAFRREALRKIPLHGHGFGLEAELFSLATRLSLRIAHVPVDYLPREGTPKLAGHDGFRIAGRLVVSRLRPLAAASGGANARRRPVPAGGDTR
ncbi:MAG: glycosyltransferase family 2 protein [Methanobacteriota archaeon]